MPTRWQRVQRVHDAHRLFDICHAEELWAHTATRHAAHVARTPAWPLTSHSGPPSRTMGTSFARPACCRLAWPSRSLSSEPSSTSSRATQTPLALLVAGIARRDGADGLGPVLLLHNPSCLCHDYRQVYLTTAGHIALAAPVTRLQCCSSGQTSCSVASCARAEILSGGSSYSSNMAHPRPPHSAAQPNGPYMSSLYNMAYSSV